MSTTKEEACCTCASLLSTILPQYDEKTEKPGANDRRLNCCGRVICGKCIAVSSSLVPALRVAFAKKFCVLGKPSICLILYGLPRRVDKPWVTKISQVLSVRSRPRLLPSHRDCVIHLRTHHLHLLAHLTPHSLFPKTPLLTPLFLRFNNFPRKAPTVNQQKMFCTS